MRTMGQRYLNRIAHAVFGVLLVFMAALPAQVSAAASTSSNPTASQQNPQDGGVGLEGKISAPPPKVGATISTPGDGQTILNIPTTVSGLCPSGLLVKVFSNNVFVGAAQCTSGSYSMQVNLFSGKNQLVARVYDALDQAGPDSNTVTVTFNDAQYLQFGTRVALTTDFAELGANPGQELNWPFMLSGGVGPYALSIDWGDGTAPALFSLQSPGPFTGKHAYTSAGIYKVIVKATDANGTTAFLQLVGVANGKIAQGSASSGSGGSATTTTKLIYIWWPMLILLPLIGVAFWLGRRHELFTLRKQLERSREEAR